MNTELIGAIAGALSCITFVPQVIKTWRTKSAEGVSLLMFVIAAISTVLWIIYGVSIHSPSVIYTNIVVLLLSIVMLMLQLKFKNNGD
jgi:MtN3 and saliva related transmembrane protein